MIHRVPGLMFEAVPEPDAAGGGAEAEPPAEDVVEPDADDLEPAAAEPFDPQAYFDTPEGRQLLDQQVAARVPQPEQQQQDDGLYGMPPPPDPFVSDNWAEEMVAWQAEHNRRHTDAILGQVSSAPGFQHAEAQRANEWVESTFSTIERDLKLPEGQHLPDEVKSMAVAAAAGSVPPGWEPGMGGFDPGQAVAQNAKAIHTLVTQREQAAVERYKQQILANANGHQEPGVGGSGVHAETHPEGYDTWPSSKKLDYRFGRLHTANSERL